MPETKRTVALVAVLAACSTRTAAALKAGSTDDIEAVIKEISDKAAGYAAEADAFEDKLDITNLQLKSAGVSAMPKELQDLVNAKHAAGMRMEEALKVATAQLAHDKKQKDAAEAKAKAKEPAAATPTAPSGKK